MPSKINWLRDRTSQGEHGGQDKSGEVCVDGGRAGEAERAQGAKTPDFSRVLGTPDDVELHRKENGGADGARPRPSLTANHQRITGPAASLNPNHLPKTFVIAIV